MKPSEDTSLQSSLPDRYPAGLVEVVRLKDGSLVRLRPILPGDLPALQAGFQQLSPRSIYMRFLEPYKELPEALAQRLVEVDYHTHMAIIAESQESHPAQLIGVARYAFLDGDQPGQAESAIVVVDEYQRRGLGRILMNRLAHYAVMQGVDTLVATVHYTNGEILHFIEDSGLSFSRRMLEPGVWEIRINLKTG